MGEMVMNGMFEPAKRKLRALSKDGSVHVTDEVFNTIICTIASIFSLVGGVLLIVNSAVMHKGWHLAGFSVYAMSLFAMFLASSLHHGIEATEAVEKKLRLIDYIAVFFFIAGTFTPVCFIVARTPVGWSMFGVVWVVALIGAIIKWYYPDIPKWFTNTLYVAMGWIGVVLIVPVYHAVGWDGTLLFFLAGVFYTTGSFIYYFERPNPIPGRFGFHEIWHLFVITAATIHYLVMFFYILPL